MAKIKAWWNKLSPAQRLMVAVGVPAVAVLALITSRRDDEEPAATTAGPAGVIPGGPIIGGGGGAPDPGAGGSDIFEVVRTFEDQLRTTTEDVNSTVVDVASALQSDAQARQDEIDARLEASRKEAEDREAALEERLGANVGPQYSGREAVVAQAYRDVLGRDPDAAGLRHWVASGLGYEGIRKALANTAEGRRVSGK